MKFTPFSPLSFFKTKKKSENFKTSPAKAGQKKRNTSANTAYLVRTFLRKMLSQMTVATSDICEIF